MHHRKKLRLRDWLVQKINEGKYGLRWEGDPTDRVFRVPWRHGSGHGWSVDVPHPPKRKTNFQYARNALPDIKEIRGKNCHRGKEAFKILRH